MILRINTRVGRFLLLMLVAFPLMAQSRRLNPTVKVLPKAVSAVPSECEEGLAPQPTQRAQAEETQPARDTTRDMEAPPRSDLRSQLVAVQRAAENNDRATFADALVRAKASLAGYPTGGERNAANDAIAVYDDIARLWNYQFSSPTGAFFDASSEDGALKKAMARYPGYEEAIRRQIIADANGNRFYPTSETLRFLQREAAQRLSRLGVSPTVRPSPRVVTPELPRTSGNATPGMKTPATPIDRSSRTTATKSTSVRSHGTTTRSAAKNTTTASPTRKSSGRSGTRIAAVSPSSSRAGRSPRVDAGPPAGATPARSRVTTSGTTKTSARPSQPRATEPVTSLPTTNVVRTGGTATSGVSKTGAPPSDSTMTGIPSTSTTITDTSTTGGTPAITDSSTAAGATTPPQPERARRNVILPVMLILIGIGVLIVLFRASS